MDDLLHQTFSSTLRMCLVLQLGIPITRVGILSIEVGILITQVGIPITSSLYLQVGGEAQISPATCAAGRTKTAGLSTCTKSTTATLRSYTCVRKSAVSTPRKESTT